MTADPITVTVGHEWEPCGMHDAADFLLGTMHVNGCPVHLEAIRVVDEDGCQTAADHDYAADLDHAYAINGEGPFITATITVNGVAGEYVIVATSFAN